MKQQMSPMTALPITPWPCADRPRHRQGDWTPRPPRPSRRKKPAGCSTNCAYTRSRLEMQNEELRTPQEALEASRARYFDLYDLAPVGYLTLGETGLILDTNLTAATLLATIRKGLTHRPLPADQTAFQDR